MVIFNFVLNLKQDASQLFLMLYLIFLICGCLFIQGCSDTKTEQPLPDTNPVVQTPPPAPACHGCHTTKQLMTKPVQQNDLFTKKLTLTNAARLRTKRQQSQRIMETVALLNKSVLKEPKKLTE